MMLMNGKDFSFFRCILIYAWNSWLKCLNTKVLSKKKMRIQVIHILKFQKAWFYPNIVSNEHLNRKTFRLVQFNVNWYGITVKRFSVEHIIHISTSFSEWCFIQTLSMWIPFDYTQWFNQLSLLFERFIEKFTFLCQITSTTFDFRVYHHIVWMVNKFNKWCTKIYRNFNDEKRI